MTNLQLLKMHHISNVKHHTHQVNVIFHPYGWKSTVIIRYFPSLRMESYKHTYAIFRPQARKSTKFRYFLSALFSWMLD